MKRQAGFTLIEIAVVVFLIGLLAAMGISALSSQLSNAAISATKKKQDTIKDALIAYLGKNKRLPCPAIDNSGVEAPRNIAITPGDPNCQGNFGIVPYVTLELTKSAALDGWENFFSYAVTPQWTMTYDSNIALQVAGGTTSITPAKSFNAGAIGLYPASDRSPTSPYTAIPITANAVILIISHGKNGAGALTSKNTPNALPVGTDELANAPISPWNVPTFFFQREYTEFDVPGFGAYDDVLQWFSARDLLLPLMKDGALKSADAQWVEQVLNIKNVVALNMFVNGAPCSPPSSAAFTTLLNSNNIPVTDPWNGNLTYTQNICAFSGTTGKSSLTGSVCICPGASCASLPSTTAYTVASPTQPIVTVLVSDITKLYPSLLGNCP
jgi:prepilin-type N-terminal cleavage/methylation domain-containing protein